MALTEEQRRALLDAAAEVRLRAWAPYSGFLVGAAVLAEGGQIFTGCNVENASFSHTCCAERSAVFKAVSEGERTLIACAVVVEMDAPVSPCGACRQVLYEFGPHMRVLLSTTGGATRELDLADLLPDAFGTERVLASLKKRHGEP